MSVVNSVRSRRFIADPDPSTFDWKTNYAGFVAMYLLFALYSIPDGAFLALSRMWFPRSWWQRCVGAVCLQRRGRYIPIGIFRLSTASAPLPRTQPQPQPQSGVHPDTASASIPASAFMSTPLTACFLLPLDSALLLTQRSRRARRPTRATSRASLLWSSSTTRESSCDGVAAPYTALILILR